MAPNSKNSGGESPLERVTVRMWINLWLTHRHTDRHRQQQYPKAKNIAIKFVHLRTNSFIIQLFFRWLLTRQAGVQGHSRSDPPVVSRVEGWRCVASWCIHIPRFCSEFSHWQLRWTGEYMYLGLYSLRRHRLISIGIPIINLNGRQTISGLSWGSLYP